MGEITRAGVCGAGLMGHGIAQVIAQAGIDVVLLEADPNRLAQGVGRIDAQLDRAVGRGRLDVADADAARARVTGTSDPAELADCHLVLEAITESREAKLALWAQLDPIVAPEALFATNTSSLSVIEQAAATSRPERFLGLHFFNPAPVMALVEVVACLTTSQATVDAGVAFATRLGKEPVVTRDSAGFVVNRLLVPFLLDAIRALEEGVGDVASIDRAMRLGAGHPMGPLALADLVGLDTLGAICDVMLEDRGEARFAQPSLLRRMLAAGWTGAKSGTGFYAHGGEAPVPNPLV